MPRTGRPKQALELTEREREQLVQWECRLSPSQAMALRARIILRCAEGYSNKHVAELCGVSAATVGKWRRRFCELRLDGLCDELRPGRPPRITAEQVEDVVIATLEAAPENATHWSRAKMAKRTGLSQSTIGRIWKEFDLKPYLTGTFKHSADLLFVERVYDVVGLYLNPPEAAIVYCIDEKSRAQAPVPPQPGSSMMPDTSGRRLHDDLGRGTISLFAALGIADGSAISSLHPRHRTIELKKVLQTIDSQIPEHLDVHLIAGNYGTHKAPAICRWLEKHPRFHMHCTPRYSGWINQIERWLAYLIAGRRFDHRPSQALEQDIRNWIAAWNENPTRFIWTTATEQTLEFPSRFLQRMNEDANGVFEDGPRTVRPQV